MEDFVTFEIAKKLKEKGFREECFKHYYPNSKDWFISSSPECGNFSSYIDIPIISQVLKWLREEKNFHLMVYILNDSSEDADGRIIQEWFFWSFGVQNCNSGDYAYEGDDVEYESYESAALAGIEYVLDKLI